MTRKSTTLSVALISAVALFGCAVGNDLHGSSASSGGAAGDGTGVNSGSGDAGAGAGGSGGGLVLDSGTGGQTSCTGSTPDSDGDGFTVADGDCNDCDPNANPGALDVPGNGVDEDCNGTPDDTDVLCDSAVAEVAESDAFDAARAIGLCHMTKKGDKSWGVLDAEYVMADGSIGMNSVSHGLLDGFGPNVATRQGKRMLALSSGTARQPSDPGYQDVDGYDTGTMSSTPAGFPKDSPACDVTTASDPTAYDPAALELTIRVPTNAKSFRFKFDFYTYEFPIFVCTDYNDFFVALQDPPSQNAQSGNISFDSQGNPVSVNNGFLQVCEPQDAGGKNFPCALGQSELSGTGFEGAAATGWLETTSPVTPGSIVKLRFAVWDAGDGILDSTVLIDDFEFSADPAKESETKPVPVPK
jgi:Putative metal-binding motif